MKSKMTRGPSVRALAVNVPTTSATIVLSGIPAARGSSAAFQDQTISGVLNITPGTATTAVTVRCKNQGGTQFGTSQVHTVAAAAPQNIAFNFQDVSGLVNTSYQIEVQQTAATANGTVNEIVAYAGGED